VASVCFTINQRAAFLPPDLGFGNFKPVLGLERGVFKCSSWLNGSFQESYDRIF
jgi:hypothetical protein